MVGYKALNTSTKFVKAKQKIDKIDGITKYLL